MTSPGSTRRWPGSPRTPGATRPAPSRAHESWHEYVAGFARGRWAILAVPINVLPHIAFEPALPEPLPAVTGGNAGRGLKVWMRARGLPAGSLAVGRGRELHWVYADRELADGKRRSPPSGRKRNSLPTPATTGTPIPSLAAPAD